ncbi:hypothetical protein BaRGS_00028259 [Batillaria attramentaria]|uniref:Uncharacterized protein n=1 Tax=Batillaria attramentaria TaxID=370345 RepID=A0ABD0K0L1_9CAEN
MILKQFYKDYEDDSPSSLLKNSQYNKAAVVGTATSSAATLPLVPTFSITNISRQPLDTKCGKGENEKALRLVRMWVV